MRSGDKDGRIVPDTFCNPLMEPPSEETCELIYPNDCLLDPAWIVDSFGPVSSCYVCVCVCESNTEKLFISFSNSVAVTALVDSVSGVLNVKSH